MISSIVYVLQYMFTHCTLIEKLSERKHMQNAYSQKSPRHKSTKKYFNNMHELLEYFHPLT